MRREGKCRDTNLKSDVGHVSKTIINSLGKKRRFICKGLKAKELSLAPSGRMASPERSG